CVAPTPPSRARRPAERSHREPRHATGKTTRPRPAGPFACPEPGPRTGTGDFITGASHVTRIAPDFPPRQYRTRPRDAAIFQKSTGPFSSPPFRVVRNSRLGG